MRLYAFDGTWNSNQIDDDADTNVCRFYEAFPGKDDVDKLYVKGVGTKWGFIGRAIGGVTGAGGWARVHDARKHLEKHGNGEPIAVVGFSRGSALALDFCNEISGGPVVQFLGLWDLVASFGVPGNKVNLGYQLTVPATVAQCFHAMSLDERRYTFGLTRVKYAVDRKTPNGEKKAHEVWFRGGHSDVGGGNRNVARSNIALRWMMLQALASGVPVSSARIPPAAGQGDALPVNARQWLLKWSRAPVAGERVHHTVTWSLNQGYLDPPAPFQTEADPVIT